MTWIGLALVAVFGWWIYDRRFIGVSFKNNASSAELRGYRDRFNRRIEDSIRRAEAREAKEKRVKRLAEAREDIAPEDYSPKPSELDFGRDIPVSAFGACEREIIAGELILLCQRSDRWTPVLRAELVDALLVRNKHYVGYPNMVNFEIDDFLSSGHIVATEDGTEIRITRTFVDRCAKSYRDHPPVRRSA